MAWPSPLSRAFSSASSHLTKDLTKNLTTDLVRDGFVRLPNRLPSSMTTKVHQLMLDEHAALSTTWRYKFGRFFDIVDSPLHRHSFPVPLCSDIQNVVGTIVRNHRQLFIDLAGIDGVLVELSILLTFPGASQQSIHSDIKHGALEDDADTGAPGLASVFVALQDVKKEIGNGPTHILKKTHLLKVNS